MHTDIDPFRILSYSLSFFIASSQLKSIAIRGVTSYPTVVPADDPRRFHRPMHPPPVRFGFIPDSWFTFFYPKTGASGPYMFLIGVSTFLLSKEYYVLEHEFYNGLSLLSIIMYVHIKHGKAIADYLDKQVEKYDNEQEQEIKDQIEANEKVVKDIEKAKSSLDGQLMIFDIKKQNILMQLEATYRERLSQAYREVKKRLDYYVQKEAVERRIAQKHMVQWITNSVLKAITPEQEKANLMQCIADLESLSAKA